jgi:hypothetical protein
MGLGSLEFLTSAHPLIEDVGLLPIAPGTPEHWPEQDGFAICGPMGAARPPPQQAI